MLEPEERRRLNLPIAGASVYYWRYEFMEGRYADRGQNDLDNLLDFALTFGHEELERHGEFYPFGFSVSRASNRSDPEPFALDFDSGQDVQVILEGYRSGVLALRESIRAGAVAANVSLSDGRDAIQVELVSFDQNLSVQVFQPYIMERNEEGSITLSLGDLEAGAGSLLPS